VRQRFLCLAWLLLTSFLGGDGFAATRSSDARVTQVVREVSLLSSDAPARRAVLNETVNETTAVKTGGYSRAELTFADLTISRLGANTLYHFRKSGRQVELNAGATLLRVPKDSGDATILSSAVTVGITGTTLIFENVRAGTARLTVLEGTAQLTLVRARDQRRSVAEGQTLEVPPGAIRLGDPKEIDLAALMKTSPLIVGFRPLPSQNLINNAIRQQQQRGTLNQNRPNRNGPQNTAPPPPPGPGPR
jgi:hypothetical protein